MNGSAIEVNFNANIAVANNVWLTAATHGTIISAFVNILSKNKSNVNFLIPESINTTFIAPAVSKTVAVITPTIKKMLVATKLLFESRAMPLTACPDVHPPAHADPTPTHQPAIPNLTLFCTD